MAHDASWKQTGEFANDDCITWDQETGAPTKMHLANAIQVWDLLRDSATPSMVADAAKAFNVPGAIIIAAVEEHPWMFIAGPTDDYTKCSIEHDGE